MNVSSVLHWPWPRSIVPGSPVSPVLPVSTVPLVVLLIWRGDRGQVWSLINVLWWKDLLGLVRGHYMAIPRGHLMSHLVMKRIMLHMHLRGHASHLKKTASMKVVLKVFKNVLIYWYIWIWSSKEHIHVRSADQTLPVVAAVFSVCSVLHFSGLSERAAGFVASCVFHSTCWAVIAWRMNILIIINQH